MVSFRRYLRGLKRHLIARQLPHGLINWRYLFPRISHSVQRHRDFWWSQPKPLPTTLWVILEGILWLRWIAWGSWRASLNWVGRRGRDYRCETGMGLMRQFYLLQKLALSWCIHPRQSYQFELLDHPESALDYVFDQETAGYHAYRNLRLGAEQPTLHRLQDKLELARFFSETSIRMVTTIRTVRKNHNVSLWEILPDDGSACFIKSRHGNQGRGAFKVWRQNQQWYGQTFQGEILDGRELIESAWQRLLAEDDALIQPLLRNHPSLAELAETGDAITLRVISCRQEEGVVIYHQLLEIPYQGASGIAYRFLTVTADGELHPVPRLERMTRPDRHRRPPILPSLPDYDEIIGQTRFAHQHFPDVYSIAWDWVITPDGPVLLEGNIGWGAALPQQLSGPLLSHLTL